MTFLMQKKPTKSIREKVPKIKNTVIKKGPLFFRAECSLFIY